MRTSLTFVVSLVAFFLLYFFNVSNMFAFIGVGILILCTMMYPIIRITFFETNIAKIEKFLLNNKRNPNFYITYALANELDEDIDHYTDQLLKKTKQPSRQAIYKIIRALHFKDLSEAKQEIEHVVEPDYKQYYQALIYLEENNITEADHWIEKVSKGWMKHALLAEREKKQGNFEEAIAHATKAKQQTKGIQHYLLHKTYEREFQLQ